MHVFKRRLLEGNFRIVPIQAGGVAGDLLNEVLQLYSLVPNQCQNLFEFFLMPSPSSRSGRDSQTSHELDRILAKQLVRSPMVNALPRLLLASHSGRLSLKAAHCVKDMC